MTLLMRDRENLEKGIQQGEECVAVLTKRLLQEKRYDALGRISEDREYRQRLYEEYHII